ncbi:MAG TPA: ABC transporter permease [Bacteroidia bacterium]|nr:ABC transporter permease [Bacteroidia bacterium]
MFDLDRWQEIYSTLGKNKLRTFLTAFGVFWGIFMLIIMLGSGNGLKNGVQNGFKDFATNSFFTWTQRTSMPYKGFKSGRRFNYNNDDIKAIKDNVPEAEIVAPRNQLGNYGGNNNVNYGLKTGSFSIYGDYPEIFKIQSYTITDGRKMNQFDENEKRKITVIGSRVKEVLFGENESPLGKNIEINGVFFQVVGVFKSNQSSDRGEEDASTIFIPFSTFQNAFNYQNVVGWFSITSKPEIAASVVEEKVIALLKERHAIDPADVQAIGHFNLEEEFKKMSGLFTGIELLIWIVGSGTLFAGVIGVSNIMLIIIKERTNEIGIRRAIGAPPSDIMKQIMMESIVLTTVAGYVGLVLGVGLLELISSAMGTGGDSSSMFMNPEINLGVALKALGILIVSGALAGLIPASRALKIKPIEALRSE